jgi:hypothetical protein
MSEIGFEDAASDFGGGSSNLVDGADDVVHQLVGVERAAVGEVSFRQRPNAFVGIELGSVSREVLDVQARVPTEQLGQRRAVMGGGIVPQSDDGTPEVAQQLAEKQAHFFRSDIVEEKQIVEAQVLPSGADRDSRDDRDFVAASLAMILQGSRTLGRPGSDHQGSQQEARFIGKN